ncbi:MAG: flagellar motor switch protein FliN [Spirochaetales bacterium]|jgi:flagellar motor switch protein FliN/FliY|nr:flagellar motor switch protein FliN [Spirochaetales bacterium]
MSDGSLSQDEIDALLQGGGGMDLGPAPEPPRASSGGGGGGLTPQEKQAFLGLIRGMMPSYSSNLNNLLNDTVELVNPQIDTIDNGGIGRAMPGEVVEISADFQDGISGKHSYLLSSDLAKDMAGLMMGMEDVDLSEAALSALGEAGNTLVGTASTTFGDKAGLTIMPSFGETRMLSSDSFSFTPSSFVRVQYDITVDDKPPGVLTELFDLNLVKQLVAPPQAAAPKDMGGLESLGGFGGGMGPSPGPAMPGMMAPGMGAPMNQGYGQMPQGGQGYQNVQPVQFPGLNPQSPTGDHGNISLLMDVYMEMTVELGRTKRLIKDILGMGEGTIIELDKLAGEPVDILVNHKLIAKGEVVVIDENFGVRVTEIVSPMDRVADYS